MIRLWLPYPPATNNLFINVGKRRVRSKRYDAWIKAAWRELVRHVADLNLRPPMITGAYTAILTAQRPDRRKRDIDGLIKPVLDLLVKAGVTPDDSLCERVTAQWAGRDPVKDAQIIVTLEAFDED